MCQMKDDYQMGLQYCIRNDVEKAYFYLNRAAQNGNEKAISTLEEFREKNLLPKWVTEK